MRNRTLSHFRSIEIWDTASRSDQYLREGWLTRAFAQTPVPAGFAADGVVIGSAEMGPLANGARAIALVNPAQFVKASRLAKPVSLRERNPELAHILDVENDIVKAADRLRPAQGQAQLKTVFPGGAFGSSIKTAMQVVAAGEAPKKVSSGNAPQEQPKRGQGVAVIRLTLNGFDTHQNQPGQQAALLKQLAEGLMSMKSALVELGRWDDTLVMTYAEFGRRPRENQSNGTDHGTVAPHFVHGWTRARRLVWRAAGAGAARRQWQLAGRRRFPAALRHRARAVVGTRRVDDPAAAVRAAAVATCLTTCCERNWADAAAPVDHLARHAIHSLRIGVNAMR